MIASLEVSEGEHVEQGKILATLDDHMLRRAEVARLDAELANAQREANRFRSLSKRSATSAANLDAAEVDLRIARADLDAARARLELTRVPAPIDGQILEIHARAGERVGEEGVLEMGDTGKMVAVAEVYETDPVAKADSRVVEVRIDLDSSKAVARFAHADRNLSQDEVEVIRRVLKETAHLAPGEVEFVMTIAIESTRNEGNDTL